MVDLAVIMTMTMTMTMVIDIQPGIDEIHGTHQQGARYHCDNLLLRRAVLELLGDHLGDP